MKHILLAACVALASSAAAQITLEKSYINYSQLSVHNIENEGYKYMATDPLTKQVHLFNENHSHWKTITPQIPSKTYSVTANYASTLLFDGDNGVEVIIGYVDTSAGAANYRYYSAIIDDNGSIIKSFPDCLSGQVTKVGSGWKLFAHIFTKVSPVYTDVYSLPGQMLAAMKPGKDVSDFESTAYPNPAETSVAVNYSLPTGVTAATLQLYNSNGVMLQSFPLSQNSGIILIDRRGYPAGAYHYSINAGGVQQTNSVIFQ